MVKKKSKVNVKKGIGKTARGKKEGNLAQRGYMNPWSMLSDFDRLFDDFRSGFGDIFYPHADRVAISRDFPGLRKGELFRQPLSDFIDKGGKYMIKTEVPGIPKEDVDIQITDGGIEIKAQTSSEKKDEKDKYLHYERSSQQFYRKLTFPEEVNPEKVNAELKDGVLEISVPKVKQSKKRPQKVKIT